MILALCVSASFAANAQVNDRAQAEYGRTSVSVTDSLPRPIPFILPQDLFVPKDRLFGYEPWTYAPMARPVVHILPTFGFSGSIGFGLYSIQHPDRFFSTLEGFNGFNIPHLYISQQHFFTKEFFHCPVFYFDGKSVLYNRSTVFCRKLLHLFPDILNLLSRLILAA